MPVKGERIDELLSGYIDGCLSDAESAELREALQDSGVVARLSELQSLGGDLRLLRDARQRSAPALSESFAASVWESIREQQQVAAVRSASPATPTPNSVTSNSARRRQRRWWIAIAATASAVLVLVAVQQFHPPDHSTTARNGASDGATSRTGESGLEASPSIADARPESALPADRQLVPQQNPFGERSPASDVNSLVEQAPEGRLTTDGKQWENQLMLTLVVDMRLSPKAVEANYLSSAFADQGIPLELPMIADAEAIEVLAESRMAGQPVVDEADSDDEALLYFVHADTLQIDRLVQGFIEDFESVPTLRTDIAVESPVNGFLKRVIANAGDDFGFAKNFAAQLQIPGQQAGSPLQGIGQQGMMVARSSRDKVAAKSKDVVSQLGAKSTLLLLVRHPDDKP